MGSRIFLVAGLAVLVVGAAVLALNVQGPEQAVVDELVVANRVLSQDLDIIGVEGHVSARSQRDAERFYIARNVAPALVTAADIIEEGMDGVPVGGARSDQYAERFIDAAIYSARPDAMAVVHLHTPELIAFSVSSVPLPAGGGEAPIYDIRQFNNGRTGEITTPELGQTVAEALGSNNEILLLGHGAVVVAPTIRSAVGSANRLVRGARLRMKMIAMGGAIVDNPRGLAPAGERQAASPPPAAPPEPPEGELDIRNNGTDRAWNHWLQVGARLLRDSAPLEPQSRPSDPVEAIKRDLAIASRILSDPRVGIFDTAGHISVRSPANPNHYFISRAVSPGSVSVDGLIENDLESNPVNGPRNDEYLEIYIHGEIYKARPDVMAVIHSHTQELVAFGQTSVKLEPVSNGGTFIGDGVPLWVVGQFDPTQGLVATPALGRALAEALGDGAGALLTGHGIALTDSSLYGLIKRVYDFRINAMIQQQAILLGGDITYLRGQDSGAPPPPVVPDGSGGGADAARFWEYWSRQISLE